MPKIELGNTPKNFKYKVEVSLPGHAEKYSVEMLFKYRTRTQFGAFLDELFNAARVATPSQNEEDVKIALADALAKTVETNAEYIMAIADGWNLEAEFNLENVKRMCDELPGVAQEIINSYRAAVSEGRAGN